MLGLNLGRAALAVGAASLLLGLAACGDDNDDSGLSDAEYIAKADPLCKPAPQGPQTQNPKVSAAFLRDKLVPFRKQTLANLRKLDPNDDLEPKVEAYLKESDGVNVLLLQQAAALDRNDLIKAGDLDVTIAQANARRSRAAGEVGYNRCGQPTSGPPVRAANFESREVLAAGDAACKKATDVVLATKPKNFLPPTLAASLRETLPAQRQALGVVAGLREKATKPAYAQFLRIEQQRYAKALAIERAGRANNKALFDKLQAEDGELYQRGYPIALRLGFTVCAVSSPIGF